MNLVPVGFRLPEDIVKIIDEAVDELNSQKVKANRGAKVNRTDVVIAALRRQFRTRLKTQPNLLTKRGVEARQPVLGPKAEAIMERRRK